MSVHGPAPTRISFFGAGTYILMALIAIGFAFGSVRMLAGLGEVTNLNNSFPWGIWIAIDVACGVALAAGGFTTAALVDIFGKRKYHGLIRPAILTAWLGYAWVAFAVFFDNGRYWNIWRPIFNWQGNSVLFEVGMCVMAYLGVLTVEMAPSLLEGLRLRMDEGSWGASVLARLEKPIGVASKAVKAVLPLFIIAGVVLSCMHQSSLGSLMLIAPSKLSPLWFTPLLPALFLLSAFMVGFPMVVVESIIAAKGMRRQPEMELLEPLARYIPWFIGIYLAVKLGDLAVRSGQLAGRVTAGQLVALAAEMGLGLVLPFLLLLRRSVRRSPGWLFFAAFLVVLGVVLNRINVFLVGFAPPLATQGYTPSIGELSVTLAIVCSIMFLYRFFAVHFPVLPAEGKALVDRPRWRDPGLESWRWSWAFRAAGVVFLLSFVVLYLTVHEEAISGEIKSLNWARSIEPVRDAASTLDRSQHAGRPEGYKRYYILNSKVLNTDTDYFEPVRFSHMSHDAYTRGNCGVCHHRFSFGDDDRTGEDLVEFHAGFDTPISGVACAACHDMGALHVKRCDSCHWASGELSGGNPVGLKGAYHRQCIGCHERDPNASRLPTACASCHYPNVPDHAQLVSLPANPTPEDVTAACLSCHEQSGADTLKAAHWRWPDHTKHVGAEKAEAPDAREARVRRMDFVAAPNLRYCATCHVGLGWTGAEFDLDDPRKIDCLVCHDTTGTYRKAVRAGGRPVADVDLVAVATTVGRPGRDACGTCHFRASGGLNDKLDAVEAKLGKEAGDLDVHLGAVDMRCQDCHKTERHRIAGTSLGAPTTEARAECEACHGVAPHRISGPLGRHLDDHVKAVSCESCHIPAIARQTPVRVLIDYSTAGQDRPDERGLGRMPVYEKVRGEQTWAMNLTPVYLWSDGTRQVHPLGEPIDPSATTDLNRPLGERLNPQSRIYPFKIEEAIQPYDAVSKTLVVPQLDGGYWEHFDWDRAIADGMRTIGLEYSGQHGFARTRFFVSAHHEVVPSKQSLACADCHETQAVTCGRCHAGTSTLDVRALIGQRYPSVEKRFDFKALGYPDDPARSGGRFTVAPGIGRPIP